MAGTLPPPPSPPPSGDPKRRPNPKVPGPVTTRRSPSGPSPDLPPVSVGGGAPELMDYLFAESPDGTPPAAPIPAQPGRSVARQVGDVLVESRLAGMDGSLEEAAMDLGARPAKVFFVITLPLIAPALVAGWLLAFTLSLDDVVVASFVSGPGSTTLPMVIFSSVKFGISPQINALATLMVLVVATGIFIASIVLARQERQRKRDEQMAIQNG